MKAKDMEKMDGVWQAYLVHFILLLVQVSIFAFAIPYLDITAYDMLIKVAVIAWFAMYTIPMAGSMIWEGRSATLFVINTLHNLVAILVSVIVHFAMMMQM